QKHYPQAVPRDDRDRYEQGEAQDQTWGQEEEDQGSSLHSLRSLRSLTSATDCVRTRIAWRSISPSSCLWQRVSKRCPARDRCGIDALSILRPRVKLDCHTASWPRLTRLRPHRPRTAGAPPSSSSRISR